MPESQPTASFDAPFFGRIYRGHLDNYIDWNVFYFGAYEREILSLICDVLRSKRDSVFWDVGANVGQHTLAASKNASFVHAFEPFAPVRAELLEKIELNQLGNVAVHAFGLGDRNASLPFFAPRGPNQGTGSFLADHAATNVKADDLPIKVGDEFAAGLGRLDLIKIDVEGFEKAVLSGLQHTLARLRPLVLFEYSATTRLSIPFADEIRTLFPPDYSLFEVETRRVFLWAFEITGCRLSPLRSPYPSATEILAIPDESLSRVNPSNFA